jgi:hypothetical protein
MYSAITSKYSKFRSSHSTNMQCFNLCTQQILYEQFHISYRIRCKILNVSPVYSSYAKSSYTRSSYYFKFLQLPNSYSAKFVYFKLSSGAKFLHFSKVSTRPKFILVHSAYSSKIRPVQSSYISKFLLVQKFLQTMSCKFRLG